MRRVYEGPDATIFRNARAAPRAFVAREVALVGDGEGARATLAEATFDAGRGAVVERSEPGAASMEGRRTERGDGDRRARTRTRA